MTTVQTVHFLRLYKHNEMKNGITVDNNATVKNLI